MTAKEVQREEIFNYPGVVSERDPRAPLVRSIRHLEREIRDHKAHVLALEESLAEKRERIVECEADIVSLKKALDRLSE